MQMKINKYCMALAAAGLALASQANASITFNFQENGSGNKGPTETFVESGISLTASGWRKNVNPAKKGSQSDLWAKYTAGDPSETGLGMKTDLGNDHEVDIKHFIQLTLPTSPATSLESVVLGSVQHGESAILYWSDTFGVLGTTVVGSIANADGTIIIPSMFRNKGGYLGITAGADNILLSSATFAAVPEASTYVAGALMVLPFGASILRIARRKQAA
jgi:hypothetical protein